MSAGWESIGHGGRGIVEMGTLSRKEMLCLEQRYDALGWVLQKGHQPSQSQVMGRGQGWRQVTAERCLSLDLEQVDDDVNQGGSQGKAAGLMGGGWKERSIGFMTCWRGSGWG